MKVNGSLVFDASSASEIQNLRIEKVATNPTHLGAADQGRLIFNTTDGKLYQGSATAWVAIATGGDASALQTEVDALETSLGSIVNGSGVFVTGQVTGPAFTGTEASVTELLQALSNYANANNTLAELDDVSLTAAATGDILRYNGSAWADASLSEAGIQPLDATLTALAALSGTGIVVETGVDAFTHRSIVAPAAGITITDGDGVAGNPTLALANDLAALEGLTTNGLIARTGDGSAATRTITGPAAGITVTNGDGVSGNPTLALANDLAALEGLATTGYIVRTGDGSATTRSMSVVSGELVITGDASGATTDTTFGLADAGTPVTGAFVKITTDAKGRVTATSNVVTADITALVDATYVNITGDTMSGSLNMGTTNTITGLAAPTADTDAATKAYVDALTNGLSWKDAVRVASTANVTISAPGASIDGVTLTAGDRVLLKDQTTASENGIYVFNGAASAMTRASDMNDAAEFDGAAVFVYEGTQQGSGWTETATVTTVGTDTVTFSQFTGGALYTWGTGLALSGNTVNVVLGAGIVELPSDEVGLDIVSGKAVQLTSSLTGGQLTFVLDEASAGDSGLTQSAAGLKIQDGKVTNAMLTNDSVTVNGDSGTGDLALGGTLEVKGTSTQGITTSVNGTGTFTITASDATSSQKGVATFNTGDFLVTAGDVTIKAGGVDNVQLANSTITLTGTDASTDAVALGETVTFSSTTSGLVTAAVAANGVALDVRKATTSLVGVASFAAADFAVSGAGEVTMVGKALPSLTDVDDATVATTSGHVLAANGTAWINKKIYHVETVSVAATSWSVTHNLGVKYCNVTVVDASDEVVIPQSITFNSTTGLTVTFNTAITGKVVVMGIA